MLYCITVLQFFKIIDDIFYSTFYLPVRSAPLVLNCHLAAPIPHFNFLFRSQVLEISVPILRLKRCVFCKELFQYLLKWYSDMNNSVQFPFYQWTQCKTGQTSLSPTVVIALDVVTCNLVKTVDKGCQTLTSGHKSIRVQEVVLRQWFRGSFLYSLLNGLFDS